MKRHCLLVAGGLAAITLASSLRTLAIESIVPQDIWFDRLRPISAFVDNATLPPKQLEALRDWISDSSLHFVDYAICKNDRGGSRGCAEPLRTATKIAPADGRVWLERAVAVASQGGSKTEFIESLLVSYKISAREGWIAGSRLRFALQVWPDLPESIRALAVGDLLKPWEEALNSLTYAVEFLHLAGERGNVYALERLGQIYLNGEGVGADAQRAQKFFEQAISLGSVRAQIRLGIALVNGKNLPKNTSRGQQLLQAAAERESWGKVALANSLLSGELPRDPDGALALLQSASESGDYYALERLGQIYLHGQGVQASAQEGRAYLERAIAAGSVGAQVELGTALVKGEKLERNVDLGARLLEAAAVTDSWAKLALADLLLSGELPRDVRRALGLLHAAAQARNPHAWQRLGEVYLNGEGVAVDEEKGREYLARASAQGVPVQD